MTEPWGLRDGLVEDRDLVEALRAGDAGAMEALYRRHGPSMRRLAYALDPDRGDDLVAEAFSRVFDTIRAGRGPLDNVAGYLATTVRHLHVDQSRARRRELPVSDRPWLLDDATEVELLDPIDLERAGQALSALPERWREVLWYLEVEGRKPAEVALRLGMPAPRVSALAYRAREGLRRSYLDRHLTAAATRTCRWTRERLSSFVRGGLSDAAQDRVRRHLDSCNACLLEHGSLVEVNTRLGIWFWPLAVTGFTVLRPELWPKGLVAADAVGGAPGRTPRRAPRAKRVLTKRSHLMIGVGAVIAVIVVAAVTALAPTVPIEADAAPPGAEGLDEAPPRGSEPSWPELTGDDLAAASPRSEPDATAPELASRPVRTAQPPVERAAPAGRASAQSPQPRPTAPAPGGGNEPEPRPGVIRTLAFESATLRSSAPGSSEWRLTLSPTGTYTGHLEPVTLAVSFRMDQLTVFTTLASTSWRCDAQSPPYQFVEMACHTTWVPGQPIEPLSAHLSSLESGKAPRGVARLSPVGVPGATSSAAF
ncbi:sigma-70 family RNA polymerase sigma factor [Aeromicrobium camelliae]|uniref:Sigma-70 family RNA polymerase sigma factor n=1 Tax=Aeromicrobium camelliae TaxID=1538144 RepID=A0A3N6ZM90_9ACTN|nr:sigma-70 family RNA polymerase sigma factor [Aeromicrobium camelliae]RQN08157.1 sigma-70 family RNA polymerase sigma factor [Aeromicrobium camelliae]